MAYEKTNWSSGDVITAEKLNNIESGVEDAGVLVVNDSDGFTFRQLSDALGNGRCVALYNISRDNGGFNTGSLSFLYRLVANENIYIAVFGAIDNYNQQDYAVTGTYKQTDPDAKMYVPD